MKKVRSLLLRLSLGFSVLGHASAALALVVEAGVIEAALEQASLVGSIRIEALTTEPDGAFRTRWRARARLLGVKAWRDSHRLAPDPGDVIEVTGVGGEHGAHGILFSGYPKPFRNRVYSAHLQLEPDGSYTVAGFDRGLVPVFGERQFSRNRTDGSNGEGTGPFLYWDPRYFPIPYFISSPSFASAPDFVAAIDESFRTWAAAKGSRVDFLAMGCSSSSTNENDGINNVILVTRDWPFDDTVIAITRNFFIAGTSPSAGLILDSDILLNAVDHEFSLGAAAGKHDVQNIVTHEVGHLLGLGHEVSVPGNPDDSEATMFAVAQTNEVKKRSLAANDLNGLLEGYAGSAEKIGLASSVSCSVGTRPSCAGVRGGGGSPWAMAPLLLPLLLPWMARRRRAISAP